MVDRLRDMLAAKIEERTETLRRKHEAADGGGVMMGAKSGKALLRVR